eukprot:1136156-Pelagomonas_calceolata.AAC.1
MHAAIVMQDAHNSVYRMYAAIAMQDARSNRHAGCTQQSSCSNARSNCHVGCTQQCMQQCTQQSSCSNALSNRHVGCTQRNMQQCTQQCMRRPCADGASTLACTLWHALVYHGHCVS